jgi:serine/threonine protein kinase
MAYELIAPSEEEEEETIPRVTIATDIWAFGMTALEVSQRYRTSHGGLTHLVRIQIITGKLPFFNIKYDTAVILSVMRGNRPKHETYPAISHSIWSILERCWHADPTQRPSMEHLSGQVLRHAKPAFRLGSLRHGKHTRWPVIRALGSWRRPHSPALLDLNITPTS